MLSDSRDIPRQMTMLAGRGSRANEVAAEACKLP